MVNSSRHPSPTQSGPPHRHEELVAIAQKVRAACLASACRAWEQAGVCGLCGEGAFEAATGAMQMLDVEQLVRDARGESAERSRGS